MRVLSRLFRRLFLDELEKLYQEEKLQFLGELNPLKDPSAFARYLAPWREREWVVYAKPPFGGPQQVLEYLGRYTHKVAISNQRLLRINDGEVTFQWKDYRHHDKHNSRQMTLASDEFIRRFLIHTLPPGFQRIRHFGLLSNRHRQSKLALCRKLLAHPITELLPDAMQCLVLLRALAIQPSVLCPHARPVS